MVEGSICEVKEQNEYTWNIGEKIYYSPEIFLSMDSIE